MIKFLLKLLIDAFGIQRVNNTLSEICNDEANNTPSKFYFYDGLSEAYDKIEDEFFKKQ